MQSIYNLRTVNERDFIFDYTYAYLHSIHCQCILHRARHTNAQSIAFSVHCKVINHIFRRTCACDYAHASHLFIYIVGNRKWPNIDSLTYRIAFYCCLPPSCSCERVGVPIRDHAMPFDILFIIPFNPFTFMFRAIKVRDGHHGTWGCFCAYAVPAFIVILASTYHASNQSIWIHGRPNRLFRCSKWATHEPAPFTKPYCPTVSVVHKPIRRWRVSFAPNTNTKSTLHANGFSRHR